MDKSVQQLIGMVKDAAPVVWQAAYRQVYVDAGEAILMALLCIFLSVWGSRWLYRNWDKRVVDDTPLCVLGPIGIFLTLIGSVAFFFSFVDDVANPTFQAIKMLGSLVGK